MNRRMVIYRIGQIMLLEAALLFIPMVVSVIYGEVRCFRAFAFSVLTALAIGAVFKFFFKPSDKVIFAREGFSIVAFAWILLSLVGALPFYISGEIPNFADAFFETVSGFTTTGASILTDVEAMSQSLLFWRSFTHWIGGMGVLVLIMAIIPSDSGRSMHIIRAEMPGPVVGKLVPKLSNTAKILYVIYFVLTFIETVLLIFGGMPVFDSIVYALGTAGTGGYGIKADSVGSYSPYLQWVIAVFMVIFGVNFNLFYLILLKKFGAAFKNTELWFYFGIIAVSTMIIMFSIYPMYSGTEEAFRHSFFQVSSIISTTGYSTADFNQWPSLAKGIIFVLLFVGGCAGSTAGGLKISRVLILFKLLQNDIKQMLHPRAVTSVKIDGKTVDSNTLKRVTTYFALYILLNTVVFLLISYEPFDLETNLTAAISCVNNVGPGLGDIGPAGSYAGYSDISTVILSFAMLLGRLEIFPIILAFDYKNWINKNK